MQFSCSLLMYTRCNCALWFSVCQCIRFGIARYLFTSCVMAKSKYEYVRCYEQDVRVAVNNFIVLRIDGRGFHRYTLFIITQSINLTFGSHVFDV